MALPRVDSPITVLTPEELLEISRDISLNFALKRIRPRKPKQSSFLKTEATLINSEPVYSNPVSDTTLTAQELLEISTQIRQEFTPKLLVNSPQLTLLPVDPHHLYAYWDVGEQQFNNPLILRIYWYPPSHQNQQLSSNIWLDIPIEQSSQCKQLRVPLADSMYSAALGEIHADYQFNALAHSNTIHVPATQNKHIPVALHLENNVWELAAKSGEFEYLPHFPVQGWRIKLHSNSNLSTNNTPLTVTKLSDFLHYTEISAQLIPEYATMSTVLTPVSRASGLGLGVNS